MVISIALTLLVLTFLLVFFLIIDRSGEPLSERVTVKRRKFTPAHIMFTGKTIIPVPNRWTVAVENQNGRGVVVVSQPLYESIEDGETIWVNGKRGRITKQWYLKEARKEQQALRLRDDL